MFKVLHNGFHGQLIHSFCLWPINSQHLCTSPLRAYPKKLVWAAFEECLITEGKAVLRTLHLKACFLMTISREECCFFKWHCTVVTIGRPYLACRPRALQGGIPCAGRGAQNRSLQLSLEKCPRYCHSRSAVWSARRCVSQWQSLKDHGSQGTSWNQSLAPLKGCFWSYRSKGMCCSLYNSVLPLFGCELEVSTQVGA